MRAPLIAVVTTALLLLTAGVGCAPMCPPVSAESPAPAARSGDHSPTDTHAPTAKTGTPKTPEQRRMYRLDYVVSTSEAGKPAAGSTYTLNLGEDGTGELRLGMNVALTPQTRQDVGLMLHCSFTVAGEDLLLQTSAEISSVEDTPATIRKISTHGDALVSPGKPALVSSLEDPISHKRYEVTVTATKLR